MGHEKALEVVTVDISVTVVPPTLRSAGFFVTATVVLRVFVSVVETVCVPAGGVDFIVTTSLIVKKYDEVFSKNTRPWLILTSVTVTVEAEFVTVIVGTEAMPMIAEGFNEVTIL